MIFYESENLSKNDIIGTSVYNITPDKAGKYFVKVHCFCFEEQLLKAGQKILMPVSFLLAPIRIKTQIWKMWTGSPYLIVFLRLGIYKRRIF